VKLPLLHLVADIMHERRSIKWHLIAVGRVAPSVAHALVLVEYRYALYVVATRFGHARVRAVGYVRPRQGSADDLQRFFVDGHLRRYKCINYYKSLPQRRLVYSINHLLLYKFIIVVCEATIIVHNIAYRKVGRWVQTKLNLKLAWVLRSYYTDVYNMI